MMTDPWLLWIAHDKKSVAICVPVHPVVMFVCVCVFCFRADLLDRGGRWSLAQVALSCCYSVVIIEHLITWGCANLYSL